MRSVDDCDMLNAHFQPVRAKIPHRQHMKIYMENSVEHLFEIGTRIAHTKVGHVHSCCENRRTKDTPAPDEQR